MKTYKIVRGTGGQIGVVVVERSETSSMSYLLPHAKMHSPTGMETGYGGSGPADLAASILADFLGVETKHLLGVWRKGLGHLPGLAGSVIKLHQLFKADFIQRQGLTPGESYEIHGRDIQDWLAIHKERIHGNKND